MTGPVPLGVLDLVPISAGSDASTALRNTIDLAATADALGYSRYWFAEHHLNPGVAGSSPAVLIALVAGATTQIRLGSGGVQSGHRTALSIVEEFGLLDSLHPGRIDLGIGRSGGRNFLRDRIAAAGAAQPGSAQPGSAQSGTAQSGTAQTGGAQSSGSRITDNGLVIPARPPLGALADSPRIAALTAELLQQQGGESAPYGELIRDVLGLLRGDYRSAAGIDPNPVPGRGAGVEVWVLGSSAGESASAAGAHGLRFAANYHVSPATVLEATEAYREAFVPSDDLADPYVAVSADVVVGPDDETARLLAEGYALWVRSIRRGEGAIPFPSAEAAREVRWSKEDRDLVRDRVETQFVGSARTVTEQLQRLRDATGADELIITTITHRHEDRIASYRMLAHQWQQSVGPPGHNSIAAVRG